jgi:Uncharacterized conserved protein (DUF2190)
MARNKVEYHIQDGSLFTFKVKAGQTVKIGDLVEIQGDMEVGLPSALTSQKVIGQVYSGTVGIDGLGVGYQGNNGDVATVIVLKPITYVTAGENLVAGDVVQSNTTGKAVKITTGNKVGLVLKGASSGADATVLLG